MFRHLKTHLFKEAYLPCLTSNCPHPTPLLHGWTNLHENNGQDGKSEMNRVSCTQNDISVRISSLANTFPASEAGNTFLAH
ncbi:hypothetical protein FKM82_016186 [Ascaphus truei]